MPGANLAKYLFFGQRFETFKKRKYKSGQSGPNKDGYRHGPTLLAKFEAMRAESQRLKLRVLSEYGFGVSSYMDYWNEEKGVDDESAEGLSHGYSRR
jgi:hypothetical protein